MPDDDVIPRRVPRYWRKAARLSMGGGSPTEVAPSIAKALAATLRETGGCPGLGEIGRTVYKCATGEEDWDREYPRLKELAARNPNTKIAVGEGRALLNAKPEEVARSGSDGATIDIAEALLRRHVGRDLLGRIRPLLVTERFEDYESEQLFENACLSEIPLRQLAERLVAHESGEGLKAPASTQNPESTEALLHKPIVG